MTLKNILRNFYKKICCFLSGNINIKNISEHENNTNALNNGLNPGSIYYLPEENNRYTIAYVVTPPDVSCQDLKPPIAAGSSQCGYGIPGCFIVSDNPALTETKFRWYDSPSGGTLLQDYDVASPSYYHSPISITTTFYVSEVIGNCETNRVFVSATVNPTDEIEINANNTEICMNQLVALTASNIENTPTKTYTYQWFNGDDDSLLHTGTNYSFYPFSSGQYSFYAIGTDGSCKAKSNTITVNVFALPVIPQALVKAKDENDNEFDIKEIEICGGKSVTLYIDETLINENYTYTWNPGNIEYTEIIVSPINTTNYSLTVTDNTTGCSVIDAAVIEVIVNDVPPAPSANGSSHCGSMVPYASVTSLSGASTPIFNWYDASTGGNLLYSGTSYSWLIPVSVTTTWYVSEISAEGCEGPRVALTADVVEADPISINALSASGVLGDTLSLEVIQDGFNNFYDYTWSAFPEIGSGVINDDSVVGSPIDITPTSPGIYTYTVTGTDMFSGCVAVAEFVYEVPGDDPLIIFETNDGGATLPFNDANSFENFVSQNGENSSINVTSYIQNGNYTYVYGTGLNTLDNYINNGLTTLVGVVSKYIIYITSDVFNKNLNLEYLIFPNLEVISNPYALEGCSQLKNIDFSSIISVHENLFLHKGLPDTVCILKIPFSFINDPSLGSGGTITQIIIA